MRAAGGGGGGREVVSFRRWTKESDGRLLSTWMEKSPRGWLPVDENKETVSGCTDLANIVL
jgi:hypothetical protein